MFIGLFFKKQQQKQNKHHHFYALHYKKKPQANKIITKKSRVFLFGKFWTWAPKA